MNYESWQKNLAFQSFWQRLIDIISEKRWCFRYKAIWDDDEDVCKWETRLFLPAECYIDSAIYGPAAKWEVEWIEIDPIIEEETDKGSDIVDDIDYICAKLSSEGFEFDIINHFIRIKTPPPSSESDE